MNARRDFIKQGLLLAGSGLLSGSMGLVANSAQAAPALWRMPDEGAQHAATWMAFGADEEIWGARLQAGARAALAEIARAIAQYEPVNMLVRPEEYAVAARLCGDKVKLIEATMDDLWLRDTGPVFVKMANGERAAVSFNFNGWGNKQPHADDARLAKLIADKTGISLLRSKLVLEGGGIEVDGEGTAIMTESCVLNANRNPGVSKAACEAQLKTLLGLDKIIWLPGIAGKDITDGHTDFYARFTSPGVVVAGLDNDPTSYDYAVTRRHLDILHNASDARGRKLKIVEMSGPSSIRKKYENEEFAAGYINFYVCNKAVIAPQFGDAKSDGNSRAILRELFPGRDIIQLNIDAIAAGGGGIHCTTQQQPG